MTSTTHSLIAMSMTAYWTIRARLLQVPGVANVAIWNERLQMMTVQVDPTQLAGADVTLDQVMETTADAVDSGLLRFSDGQRHRHRRHHRDAEPAAPRPQRPAHRHAGRPGQGPDRPAPTAAATPRWATSPTVAEEPPAADRRRRRQRRARPPAGRREAAVGQHARADRGRRGGHRRRCSRACPASTSTRTIFQQADFIQLAIDNLTQALVLGFLLVVVILALFLFEWRVALISLLTIPLSLVATLLVLYWRGATINTMTLAGLVIALGAVVDDAIIDVENIVRRLRQHRLARQRASRRRR